MSAERCPISNEDCKYWNRQAPVGLEGQDFGCFSDEHHLYWPKHDYRARREQDFRNSPENKVQICRRLHDEIHYEDPPEKYTPREDILNRLGQLSIELFGE